MTVDNLMAFNLQKMSIIYLSTSLLCNTPELNNLIFDTTYVEIRNEMELITEEKYFKNIESKVKKLLSKLPAIGIFKHMILEMLRYVTWRICRWKYKYAWFIGGEFMQCFHWTIQGRIDNIKTAKCLIKNTRIPIIKRFMLASVFCLENEIMEILGIMENMPNGVRSILMEQDYIATNPFIRHWTRNIYTERNHLRENFREEIHYAIIIESSEAIRYYFSLIPPHKKSGEALICFHLLSLEINEHYGQHENLTDIGYFLFCEMSEIFQVLIFNSDLYTILTLLLYPKGQTQFLHIFQNNFHHISEQDILKLLEHVSYKIYVDKYKDYDYFKLFVGIWNMLSEETVRILKNHSFLEYGFCKIINRYFRMIFIKKTSKKAKMQDIFAKRFFFNQDKWKLILFLIKKEIVTAESLKSNKMDVLKHLNIRKSNKSAWGRLLKFVKENGP